MNVFRWLAKFTSGRELIVYASEREDATAKVRAYAEDPKLPTRDAADRRAPLGELKAVVWAGAVLPNGQVEFGTFGGQVITDKAPARETRA